jgi:two-component system sensor histidine kinase BaeS
VAITLRTRLFLVVAALLGVSIVVSALLSRRVTMVEMRTITEKRRSVAVEAPLPSDLVTVEMEAVSRRPVPLWVWTTIATGIIAVPLVFASARRILGPIGALTEAANRMQAGERHVRVDVKGDDELAELGRAFNGMAAKLAETERLRRQLISDVAHELRSPVTNLRCTLESIQDGLAQPDRANIDALHEETLFLQRLIADLQDLTLADAGQLTMRSEAVDLQVVLTRAVAAAGAGGGAAIRTELAEPLAPVQGDPDRLEQAFRNLLANAVTHTPHDGVITVRAAAGGPRVVIEVMDTGCGILADHLPHVFDRFYRADGSRSRATGGAGLGLAIARQFVEAHGGSITAASGGAGAGACFTVTIPVAG